MPRTLTIILDRAELGSDHASAVAAIAALPDDGPLLVFDPDAWVAAVEGAPRRVILPAPSMVRDAGRHEVFADRLLEFWRCHAASDGDPWSMPDLVGYRHVRWTRRLALVAVPLIETLDEVRPTRVRLLSMPGGHGLDGPPEQRRTGVLAGVAANLAGAADIALELRPPAASTPASAGEPSATAADRAGAAPPSPGHVLIISDGPESGRDRSLAEAIASLSGRPVLRVVPDPGAGLRADASSGSAVMSDAAYAGPRVPRSGGEPDAAVARLQLAAAGLDPGDPARLFAGPGLTPHLRFLAGDYRDALRGNVDRWIAALEHHRPVAVVASYPGVPLEVAARLGIPSVLLPHGPMMIGEDRYHRCLPESVAIGAVGPRHRAALLADGIAADRVRVTGVPGTVSEPMRPRRPGRGRGVHLLLPTGEAARPTQVGTLPVVDFAREHACIAGLAEAVTRRGWTLEVRPHPRYDRDAAYYDAALGRMSGVSVVPATRRRLADAVAEADAVVFTGAPSSALAEAASAGRPVFRLSQAELLEHAGRWGLEAEAGVADVATLIRRLEPLAADDGAWTAAAEQAVAVGRDLLAPGGDLVAAAFVLDRVAGGDPTEPNHTAPAGGPSLMRPTETT